MASTTVDTDTASPPVRPSPYIPAGNGWTLTVRVPGFGTWQRSPSQVSMGWAVYNQDGREYHVTIASSYIADPANPTPDADLSTHVTSNAAVGNRVLRWPKPGDLSAVQKAWINQHNGGDRFNALIAAFSDQLQRCARNVRLSRDYDRDLASYQAARHREVQQRHKDKAVYEQDLKEWVNDYPPEAYQVAFRVPDTNEWCVLDLDRDLVVQLADSRRVIWQQDDLNRGFVDMCRKITDPAVSLTDTHCADLTAKLVLLRINETVYALPKSDFDRCPPVKGLLNRDRLVEQAAEKWASHVASGEQYTMVAADKSFMNVNGPDRGLYHLAMGDLLDRADLIRGGVIEAEGHASAIGSLSGVPGVYEQSAADELARKLPRAVRIVRGQQADAYALEAKLRPEWSKELEKVSSVDPVQLAKTLAAGPTAACQIFAEELQVGNETSMIVYLGSPGGETFYVGPKAEVLPDAKKSNGNTLVLKGQARSIRTYFGGGLPATVVAQSQDSAVVICDNGGNPILDPVIFIDKAVLTPFDLDAARKGFAAVERERKLAKEKEVSEARLVVAQGNAVFKNAWDVIMPQVREHGERSGLLRIYVLDGNIFPAPSNSELEKALDAKKAVLADTISVSKYDRAIKSKGWYRYIALKCQKSTTVDWAELLAKFIKDNKPDLPGDFKAYIVTVR